MKIIRYKAPEPFSVQVIAPELRSLPHSTCHPAKTTGSVPIVVFKRKTLEQQEFEYEWADAVARKWSNEKLEWAHLEPELARDVLKERKYRMSRAIASIYGICPSDDGEDMEIEAECDRECGGLVVETSKMEGPRTLSLVKWSEERRTQVFNRLKQKRCWKRRMAREDAFEKLRQVHRQRIEHWLDNVEPDESENIEANYTSAYLVNNGELINAAQITERSAKPVNPTPERDISQVVYRIEREKREYRTRYIWRHDMETWEENDPELAGSSRDMPENKTMDLPDDRREMLIPNIESMVFRQDSVHSEQVDEWIVRIVLRAGLAGLWALFQAGFVRYRPLDNDDE